MPPLLKHMKRTPLALAVIGVFSVCNIAYANILTDGDVSGGVTSPEWIYSGNLVVGGADDGEMQVLDGSKASSVGVTIGQSADANGKVTVEGQNSVLDTTLGAMTVGQQGSGVLNITDGGRLNTNTTYVGHDAGSSGHIEVTGNGTILNNQNSIYLGFSGHGSMDVTDGAVVFTANNTVLGAEAGSSGQLYIEGTGSAFYTVSPVAVGGQGNGQLVVTNGGQLNSDYGMIGVQANGSGSVVLDGDNSQWNTDGDLKVGIEGDGNLVIQNGAQLNTGNVYVAEQAGSRGNVVIGAGAPDSVAEAGYINASAIVFGDGNGSLIFNHSNTDYEFNPMISGNGDVIVYNGTTILTAANDHSGVTSVQGGVLKAGATNTLSAQSHHSVEQGLLDLNGYDQTVASLKQAGTIDFAGTGNTTLTVNDSYYGVWGQINMSGNLAGDASVTDKLIIKGDSEGISYVTVKNMGGSGAQTVNGIELIHVDGVSNAEFIQRGRIAAGAYDYTLARGSDANAGNWYLTSIGDNSVDQQRPEASSYGVNLIAANTLFVTRLHDRLGETQYIDALTGEKKVTSLWLRNEGGHTRSRDTTGQLSTQSNRYVVQLGGDVDQWSSNDRDRLHLGVMAGYANSKGTTESRQSGYNSKASVDGYSAGAYATWYANDADKSGLYVDGWVQYGWFNNTVDGQELSREKYKSQGFTTSVESGYTFKLGENTAKNTRFFIQPKAQVIWMGVKADEHKESNGTYVTGEGNNNIQTRLGARLFMNGYSTMDKGKDRLFQPFVETNWIHNSKDFGATLDGVTIKQDGAANIGELKVGLEAQINRKANLWGSVAQQMGDKGYSDTAVMFGGKFHF